MDYFRNVALVKAQESVTGPDRRLRVEMAKSFMSANEIWFRNTGLVKSEALETKNYFVYFHALVNEVKVLYEFEVFINLVHLEEEIPGVVAPEKPDSEPRFEEMLEKIDTAYKYFNNIHHIENLAATLSIKYEILHYLQQDKFAKEVLAELSNLMEAYDLKEQKRRFGFLKNNGTTHERFKAMMDDAFLEEDKIRAEIQKMVKEMEEMDEEERTTRKTIENRELILLLPIGLFEFPFTAKETVYQILNIAEQAKENFNHLYNQKIIPVANIYSPIVDREGPGRGIHEDRGLISWRNIYRIRKAFFENMFFRNESRGNVI